MQYPMNLIAAILISAVIAYLLGSISFSIIFTKYFNKEDIRTMGSGNAGMTNVLRSAGLKPGILTTIFDFLKGVVSCLIGMLVFSAFLGKNTETARYGVYVAGIACDFSEFLVIAIASKYVSLGSICAAATFPFWGWLFNYLFFFRPGLVSIQYMTITTLLLCFLSALIVSRHHSNISRLLHGTEKKFQLHHENS